MKWMIASDLHGSYYYAQQLQQAFEREQADRLLFLGDLLYHGPRNDLPRDYAPKKVIPLLNSLAPKLLCVRGNCDADVDQMVLNFPVLADYAVLPVGQRLGYGTPRPEGAAAGLLHPRPCVQPEPSAAPCPGGYFAPRSHPCARMDKLRAGEPLLKPRLREHSQGKHRPQLHDLGGKHRLLEDHGGRVLPPAAVVIML